MGIQKQKPTTTEKMIEQLWDAHFSARDGSDSRIAKLEQLWTEYLSDKREQTCYYLKSKKSRYTFLGITASVCGAISAAVGITGKVLKLW